MPSFFCKYLWYKTVVRGFIVGYSMGDLWGSCEWYLPVFFAPRLSPPSMTGETHRHLQMGLYHPYRWNLPNKIIFSNLSAGLEGFWCSNGHFHLHGYFGTRNLQVWVYLPAGIFSGLPHVPLRYLNPCHGLIHSEGGYKQRQMHCLFSSYCCIIRQTGCFSAV